MIALLIVVSTVVVLVRRRQSRRTVLAGLVSDRPSFTIAPPTRWATTRKDYRL